MNVFNKVTLQSLKKNRTRTIVTIIGIILSAAMICAVTTFVSSVQNYALESGIYYHGNWHGNSQNAQFKVYEKISNSKEVEQAIYLQQLGYAEAKGSINEYKPYIYLLGASKNAEDMVPIHITKGNYPTSVKEILIPEHLKSNGDVHYKIGDTITLDLGDRMIDGDTLTQMNPLMTHGDDGEKLELVEELVVKESRTYKVVGFYERPRFENFSAPGFTAITLADENPSSDYRYEIYFRMNNPKDIYDFMDDNHIEGNLNNTVLMYMGVTKYDGFNTMLYSMAAIVIGLIMFGSVSLIYNAFAISVSERTKQFGLLSSIGATKKQLRKMVFFEAFSVGIIGVPIGVISGIAGISITLMLIGNKFKSLGMPLAMKVYVSPVSVIAAVIIAFITVIISAWIPSRRAVKVSAVEAIRQNNDIKMKNKKVKTSKITYKLFGLPGVLANKYYKRNKRKYRATVMSLFMSIVLFVSATAFTDYLMESVNGGFSTSGHDLAFYLSQEESKDIEKDQLLEAVLNTKDVTDAAYSHSSPMVGLADKEYIDPNYILKIDDYNINDENYTVGSDITVSVDAVFVNDVQYKKLLKKYNLDKSEFFNINNPMGIAVDGNTSFNHKSGKYEKRNVLKSDNFEITVNIAKQLEGHAYQGIVKDEKGEKFNEYLNKETNERIKLPVAESSDKIVLKSAKTIREKPFFINDFDGVIMIYPESFRTKILVGENDKVYYNYYIKSENHSASYTALKDVLSNNGKNTSNLIDYAQDAEDSRNMVIIIKVFSYGFIVLISLIAAANVFNTISTNINLRRREFAMLKSVGMTAGAFNRMMNYECLLYGSRALLYGVPVSCVVTYLIYLSANSGFETAFRLPWAAIGIAVLSVFAVVFATMLYSMSKIKKDNPIEALKNENL